MNRVSTNDWMIVFLAVLGVATDAYLNLYLSNEPVVFASWLFMLAAIPIFAALLDLAINHFAFKKPLSIPKTAIITGLFVAGILDPSTPAAFVLAAAALAIISKHVIKLKLRNLFNPAAFGIAATTLFSTYVLGAKLSGSWWISATLLTVPFGLYMAYRMRKLPLVLSFFAVYAAISLAMSGPFATVLNLSFISGYFFFASFMLLEPRTSPVRFRAMVACGAAVAVIASLLPLFLSVADFTLLALLALNPFKEILDAGLEPKPEPFPNPI